MGEAPRHKIPPRLALDFWTSRFLEQKDLKKIPVWAMLAWPRLSVPSVFTSVASVCAAKP